jgi:hypothetical protein
MGGGGGQFASMAIGSIAFVWGAWTIAALNDTRKADGKEGAWFGGGGGPIFTATSHETFCAAACVGAGKLSGVAFGRTILICKTSLSLQA